MRRSLPARSRRRLAAAVAATGLAAALAAALPSNASAAGLSTTISQWSSASFNVGGPANTKVTLAAGVDEVGVVGRRLTVTKAISLNVDQSFCTTGPSGDVLVTRAFAADTKPVPSGVSVQPLLGKASIDATVTVAGTETRTPAGTGGDCGEPEGGGTSTPISHSFKIKASWKNAPGSSPLVWSDVYQQGAFYYRDATATGTIQSAVTGSAQLKNSTGGWLWSGAWVYATGT